MWICVMAVEGVRIWMGYEMVTDSIWKVRSKIENVKNSYVNLEQLVARQFNMKR